jgi:hypothetical protein
MRPVDEKTADEETTDAPGDVTDAEDATDAEEVTAGGDGPEAVDGDDGADEEADGDRTSTRSGQVRYELHEWAVESRVMLESLLAGQSVPHAWEGTDLVVPAALEDQVDGLIDQVSVTEEPNLDPDVAKTAYELEGWDDEQRTLLLRQLDAKGVPYDFDVDGSLIVQESDEDVVEAVFDEIAPDVDLEDGDSEDPEDDSSLDAGEELDAQAVMSDLFVAADRLRRRVSDHQGVLTLVERAEDVERMRLPFGFDRTDWKRIVTASVALRDLIEDDAAADDDIKAAADKLRAMLHVYV